MDEEELQENYIRHVQLLTKLEHLRCDGFKPGELYIAIHFHLTCMRLFCKTHEHFKFLDEIFSELKTKTSPHVISKPLLFIDSKMLENKPYNRFMYDNKIYLCSKIYESYFFSFCDKILNIFKKQGIHL